MKKILIVNASKRRNGNSYALPHMPGAMSDAGAFITGSTFLADGGAMTFAYWGFMLM